MSITQSLAKRAFPDSLLVSRFCLGIFYARPCEAQGSQHRPMQSVSKYVSTQGIETRE
ncbi:MAG: hypothetical protein J7L16_01195 [Deltaproteobacteria bacterium]|nr:hypothetical protein [Deltaproteobacteria bacterium]